MGEGKKVRRGEREGTGGKGKGRVRVVERLAEVRLGGNEVRIRKERRVDGEEEEEGGKLEVDEEGTDPRAQNERNIGKE